jgi:phenylpropionate dioxygenase-like ring-hydroxylating dioxygenase large terminal subunit
MTQQPGAAAEWTRVSAAADVAQPGAYVVGATEWTRIAAAADVAQPGAYVVADLDDESIVVVRSRDGVLRGFYNVCRHRGTAVAEQSCGTAVRLQCPYHAWIYDLDGRLIRAKHTDDLDNFVFEDYALRPVAIALSGDDVVARLAEPRAPQRDDALPTETEIAAIRHPYRAASLLPGRAYHDERIHQFERREWFGRDWIAIGRVEDAPDAPDGARTDAWQGFVFATLDPGTPPLAAWLNDLVDHLARFDFGRLRSVRRVDYDIAANWKLIAENYSECYHCPGLHPQLNHLTPYDLGGDFVTHGPWQGGWMELTGVAETMALQGGHRHGRPTLPGMTPEDERRIVYYLVWPTLFLSLHPDYLLVHRLMPQGPQRTLISCEWLFDPDTIARPDFDPADAIAFWDMTNRQDWHVCELQQRGTASRSWVAGRYSNQEPSVHAFDLMAADRYARDGMTSRRTVRERYDVPVPKEPSVP